VCVCVCVCVCVIHSTGALWGFGDCREGQLGIGRLAAKVYMPSLVCAFVSDRSVDENSENSNESSEEVEEEDFDDDGPSDRGERGGWTVWREVVCGGDHVLGLAHLSLSPSFDPEEGVCV